MTKAEVIKKLVASEIEHDPKATKADLEKLLPNKEAEEAPEVKVPAKKDSNIIERKINKDELIQLQKEGKLVGYNPATGIGQVKTVGSKINFPGGEAKVV